MASSWQSSHYVVVIGAAGLAFAGGYMLGGRQPVPSAVETNNSIAAPIFPGFDGNQAEAQAPPPARRGRIDENELIAANAESEDGQPQRPDSGTPARDSGDRVARRPPAQRPPPEEPPSEEEQQQEEQDPYGPEAG